MYEYQVKWEIDIYTSSPEAAAKEALKIQRSVSDATCFTTTNQATGEVVDVDLNVKGGE